MTFLFVSTVEVSEEPFSVACVVLSTAALKVTSCFVSPPSVTSALPAPPSFTVKPACSLVMFAVLAVTFGVRSAMAFLFVVILPSLASTFVFTSFNCLKLTASPSAAPSATLVIVVLLASMPVVVTDGPSVMVRPSLLIVTLSPDLNVSLVMLSNPVSVLFRLSL